MGIRANARANETEECLRAPLGNFWPLSLSMYSDGAFHGCHAFIWTLTTKQFPANNAVRVDISFLVVGLACQHSEEALDLVSFKYTSRQPKLTQVPSIALYRSFQSYSDPDLSAYLDQNHTPSECSFHPARYSHSV